MNTEVLEKCLTLIDRQSISKDDDGDNFIEKAGSLNNFYVKPFRKELDLNLLTRGTPGEKNDLIIYYISEFIRIENFPPFNTIVNNIEGTFINVKYDSQVGPMDRRDHFLVNRHYFYVLLLNEIQKCCFNYKIPFLKICSDLFFPIETIDYESAIEYKKWDDFSVREMPAKMMSMPEIKPVFNPESIPRIFDILKDYFSLEHQTILLLILKSGGNASEPILFRESGTRLADAFKQLYNCGIIKGCQKKELENWISENFYYRQRETVKKFSPRYLNDLISTNKDNCQNPILNIIPDKKSGNFTISKL